ncbi:RING-H2 finger protein [Nymphaea thermarum]|nr:RING-H2 finger protein [Nymphaea thermarum]
MRLSPLILLFILPFSLAEEETPISAKISGYFVVFSLLLCAVLLKYMLRYCRSRGSSRDSNRNIVNVEVGDLQGLSVGTPQQSSGGVDRNLINSLPVFEFAALTESSVGSECAICLGRFEGKDSLHLLPKCRHAFHRECIDKWLEDHSSCPICRQSVDAQDISAFVSSNSRDCTNLKVDGADRKRVHGFEHRITVLDANFDSTSR